jgi:hypothetical protein
MRRRLPRRTVSRVPCFWLINPAVTDANQPTGFFDGNQQGRRGLGIYRPHYRHRCTALEQLGIGLPIRVAHHVFEKIKNPPQVREHLSHTRITPLYLSPLKATQSTHSSNIGGLSAGSNALSSVIEVVPWTCVKSRNPMLPKNRPMAANRPASVRHAAVARQADHRPTTPREVARPSFLNLRDTYTVVNVV